MSRVELAGLKLPDLGAHPWRRRHSYRDLCKVDASDTLVRVGDLLTASSTPGHAMKASDPSREFKADIRLMR
jgi:hypothetical protein